MKVLPGRQFIAFPDLGACDRWRKKAKDYPLEHHRVRLPCKERPPQQREIGADLADWVVEERMTEGVEALLENPAPAHHKINLEL